MTRILVVDDHPVVRDGVVAVLETEADFVVVGRAGTGEEGLHLANQVEADVMVLDVRLPAMSGVEVCAALSVRHPRLAVLMLSSYANEGVMLDALSAGAKGFVVKATDRAVLRTAVRAVASGQTFVDSSLAAKVVRLATTGRRAKGPFDLTLQEMRVLELIPRGLTNPEIGRELGVTARTVQTHLAHAMKKLRARDRTEAAAMAVLEGLA